MSSSSSQNPSPPPSPSGRTSTTDGNHYVRSNFSSSPGRDRPAAAVFQLQDEGKGTPAWMKKLLEQKKAEYRARWGDLPPNNDNVPKKATQEEEKVPIGHDDNDDDNDDNEDDHHDGETIEEIIYEEEFEEEVVVAPDDNNDDVNDEYTEEEIIETDEDEYTFEEVTSDEEEGSAKHHQAPTRKGKRSTTTTRVNNRGATETLQQPPPPSLTQRNSFSLARIMADEVAAPSPSSPLPPTFSTPQKSNTTETAVSASAHTTNEAALRARVAALEAQLAEAKRQQASPPRPTQAVASPPLSPPPRAPPSPPASSGNLAKAAAAPRAASPETSTATMTMPRQAKSSLSPNSPPPPPPPLQSRAGPATEAAKPTTRPASSPKRVQFSEPPPPTSTFVPPPAMVPPVPVKNDEEDSSLYDYVIEIETVSTNDAAASTSVYEIEYEDASTIASRPHEQQQRPPTIPEESDDKQKKRDDKGLKPKQRSWNRVLAMWLVCCAVLILLLVGGLVAGAFLVDDDMVDFLPFVGDDSGDGESKGLDANLTVVPSPTTSEPIGTVAPTVVTSPVPGNGPDASPSPPTQSPTPANPGVVVTLRPTLALGSASPGQTTLPTRTPTFLPTTVPTVEPRTAEPTPRPTFFFVDTTTNTPTEGRTDRPTLGFGPSPPGPTLTPTNQPSSPQDEPVLEWGLTAGPFTTNAPDSRFGETVAMDGNILAVGAPGSGIVQAYSRSSSSGEWTTLNTVFPTEDAGDFGAAVSLSVGTSRVAMVVGAPTTSDGQGLFDFGAAFYYELQTTGTRPDWTQLGTRVMPASTVFTANGEAGAAVAVAADRRRMAIGAPSVTIDPNNIDNGQVFVYEFDGIMSLLSTLDGPEPGGRFGSAVAMTADGNRLLVGAPGTDTRPSLGTTYYYEWDSSAWRIIFQLPVTDGDENFGTSVAILDSAGDVIAMGGPNYSDSRGVIRVYRRQGGSFWGQLGGDIIGEPGDSLGATLASGPTNRVVAGTATGSFRAFEYDNQQNNWVKVGTGEPSFGSNVASIGSSSNGDIALGTADGSVSVYSLQTPQTT